MAGQKRYRNSERGVRENANIYEQEGREANGFAKIPTSKNQDKL